jgi:hypothetical protein
MTPEGQWICGCRGGVRVSFLVGEPASIDGGNESFPPTSGPPTATAAKKLIVTLKGGSTKTVPTRIVKPKLP